jgi:hypothetical protein
MSKPLSRALGSIAALSCVVAACASTTTDPGAITQTTAPPTSRLSDDYPDPSQFAFGREFVVRDTGIVPAQLVTIADRDVTIRNESSSPAVVVFTNGPADDRGVTRSDPIPPGGAWAFRPARPISLVFELEGQPDKRAALQVDVAEP